MDTSSVILGNLVTEKSERLKEGRIYTLRVAPKATKVQVLQALKSLYGVEPTSIRMVRSPAKKRKGPSGPVTKRRAHKKAIVTLSEKSKALDLASVQSA